MPGKKLSLAALLMLTVFSQVGEAHGPFRGRAHRRRLFDPCFTCGVAPYVECGCCAPAPPVCTQLAPILETCMVPQTCTTYRDIPQTSYLQQPVCQTVPITTMRQVTVDEGCYQTVWVPKMVTKNIAETTMQQQLSYRTVPVTTMQRVQVSETRMVPQQTLRYVPQVVPMAPPISSGCCGGSGFAPQGLPMMGPATISPGMPAMPPGAVTSPGMTAPALPPTDLQYNPPSASLVVPPSKDAATSANANATNDGEWSPVERRAAFFQSEFGSRTPGSAVMPAGYVGRR
jgi:hypothetical protein